jgi:hypothetical protein
MIVEIGPLMSGRLLTLRKTLPIVDEEVATGFTIVTPSRRVRKNLNPKRL